MSAIYSGLPQAASRHLSQGTTQAVEYLKTLDPAGPWTIVTMVPDVEGADGKTFTSDAAQDMAHYIETYQGQANVYYAVNEIKPDCHKKPTKADVRAIRATCADIDLTATDAAGQKAELRRMLDNIAALPIQPTFTILSGGGVQIVYKLARKLDPESYGRQIENLGRGLKHVVGGDSVFNIDRIMRLPGTINLPNAAKRAKGREMAQAILLPPETVRQTYTIDELSASIKPLTAAEATETNDADLAPFLARIADQFQPSPQALERVRSTATLRELWAGKLDHPDQSGSQFRWELARRLAAAGNFTLEDFAGLVRVWPFATTQDDEVPARNIARDWLRATAAFPQMRVQDWFQPLEDNPFSQAPDAPKCKDRGADGLIPLVRFSEIISRPPPVFVVARHIPEKSFGFLYSDPGAGKSFLILDLSLTLAVGLTTWQGEQVNRPNSKVLYIAAEGGSGFRNRARAWRTYHASKLPADAADRLEANFAMIERTINFMSPDDIDLLIRSAKGCGFAPDMIIVDTVSRALPGADENLQKDMTLFIKACETLQRTFGSIVLGVHHTNTKGDMRGSSVFRGAGDFVFLLTRTLGDSIGTLKCEKQKDGKDGWSRPVGFREISLEDGQSSLVAVVATEAGEASPPQALKKSPESPRQRQAEAKIFQALSEAIGPTADELLIDSGGNKTVGRALNKHGASEAKTQKSVRRFLETKVANAAITGEHDGQTVRIVAAKVGNARSSWCIRRERIVNSGVFG